MKRRNEEPINDCRYWQAKLEEARALVTLAECRMLETALNEADGHVKAAADLIGISWQTFRFRLTKHESIVCPARPRRKSLMKRKPKIEPGPGIGLSRPMYGTHKKGSGNK